MSDENQKPKPPRFELDWAKFREEFEKAIEVQREKLGRVNIIVAGDTGVGKSTLINAIFGEDFARTALGEPVTTEAEWYSKDNHPLRILDTRGLEKEKYKETLNALESEIIKYNRSALPADHIHIAWLCINGSMPRVEESHRTLAHLLNKYRIPIVLVVTQHALHVDFPEKVKEIFRKSDRDGELPPRISDVIPVRAFPFAHLNLETYNLDKLVSKTFELLPAAAQSAFVAAQKINLNLKMESAKNRINFATAAAGAAGASPVTPDIVTLVPIQITMIVSVSLAFGVTGSQVAMFSMASSVLGCLTATIAGRWISGMLLNYLPVGGWVINGAVAGGLTKAFGNAYAQFLYQYSLSNGKPPTLDDVKRDFPEYYKNRTDQ